MRSRTQAMLLLFLPFLFFMATFGFGSSAEAHSFSLSTPGSIQQVHPEQFCHTAISPDIQITSHLSAKLLGTPITTIAVSPCYLSALVAHQAGPAHVVQPDHVLSAPVVQLLQQAVLFHAHDLWTKDLSCAHPERGVSFSVITPTLLTLGMTPAPTIDTFLFLHPMVSCR